MLYRWWKEIRPLRKEPGEAVGLWDFKASVKKDDDDDPIWGTLARKLSDEDQAEYNLLLEASNKVETEYWNEDTEMMIRLVKLRGGLWT